MDDRSVDGIDDGIDDGNRDRDLARLLRLAGRRGEVDPISVARVERAVRAAWRARTGHRRLRWVGAGLAAAALLAIAIAWPRTPVPAATVEIARGATASARLLAVGDTVMIGETVRSDAGRVALRLPSGHSLRLDRDSVLRFVADGIALDVGAVYIDHAGEGSGLALRTPFGDVVQHGTQFEARLADAGLRLRVREGRVALSCDAGAFDVAAGDQIDVGDEVRRSAVPTDAADWDWTSECAPAPALDGTLAGALAWVCRERGWTLVYESAPLAETAARTRLHGLPADLAPRDALDYLLPPCGLGATRDGGRLIIVTAVPETAP